jgi:hypothetical protein
MPQEFPELDFKAHRAGALVVRGGELLPEKEVHP